MDENCRELGVVPGKPVELAAVAVRRASVRCIAISIKQPVVLRGGLFAVEGEILTVIPKKVWRFGKTVNISGDVQSIRCDAKALRLNPLDLNDLGPMNPQEDGLLTGNDPFSKYYKPIIDRGERNVFEMEQVIPFEDPENFETDPIIDAIELHDAGEFFEANEILRKVLTADLRCLDAHAHMGNWDLNFSDRHNNFLLELAKRHYQVGVEIGKLTLGKNFSDLLPWGFLGNRPFLRCYHGLGLALWRLGDNNRARKVFEHMLWLNPRDNQGARFLLDAMDRGKTWYDLDF